MTRLIICRHICVNVLGKITGWVLTRRELDFDVIFGSEKKAFAYLENLSVCVRVCVHVFLLFCGPTFDGPPLL